MAPATREQFFASACFDGRVAVQGGSARVAASSLPKSLARFLPVADGLTIYQLAKPETAYLVYGSDARRSRHCILASRSFSPRILESDLAARGFKGARGLPPIYPNLRATVAITYEDQAGKMTTFSLGLDRLVGGWTYAEVVTMASVASPSNDRTN